MNSRELYAAMPNKDAWMKAFTDLVHAKGQNPKKLLEAEAMQRLRGFIASAKDFVKEEPRTFPKGFITPQKTEYIFHVPEITSFEIKIEKHHDPEPNIAWCKEDRSLKYLAFYVRAMEAQIKEAQDFLESHGVTNWRLPK